MGAAAVARGGPAGVAGAQPKKGGGVGAGGQAAMADCCRCRGLAAAQAGPGSGRRLEAFHQSSQRASLRTLRCAPRCARCGSCCARCALPLLFT